MKKNQISHWFLSVATLVFLALTGTVARATPYASCVTNNDGTIQFYLNESNADVIVTYNDGSTNANFNGITTGTNLSSGFYSFSLGAYTNYAISVYKTGAGFPNVIQTLSESGATVNPRGIDVNRIPTSPYFGAVYWVDGGGAPSGVFLLNSDLSSMSSANPLTGGVTTFGTNGTATGQSPDFISVAPDGFVLVADASSNGAAIYRIDPGLDTNQLLLGPVGDLNGPAATNHGTIESPPIVTGSLSSSNLVLYDIDGELAPYNSIQVYNIGAGPLPWTNAPSYTGYQVGVNYDSLFLGGNEYCGLSMGTNGDIYASTYRNNFSNPVLQIYDSTGRTNLWNSWRPAGTVYPGGTPSGDYFMPTNSGLYSGLVGSQVSADGQYVAGVNAYNTLIVCPLTNGIPNLAGMLSVTNPLGTTANCRGIAWDRADNLYMSSSGLGTLQEWSLGYTTVAVTTGNTNGVTGFRVGYPPYFQPSAPTNASAYTGTTLTLPITVFGTPPLGYQLYDVNGGTNVAIGSTNGSPLNTTLTLSNVPTAWNGDQLELIVTNAYGTTNIYIALDILTNPPLVITAVPVTYTNLFTLYAGANPAFSISAAGPSLSYYWLTNGVLDGAVSAASSNMMWTNVQVGFLTNYCVISNYLGVTTNASWTAQVIADPTNSAGGLAPYPQSVLALNPIGYWRLNEGNDNGNGDDGYITYDYAGGNDGIYTNVYLGNGGYNPTADPSDTSAQFGEFGQTLPIVDNYAGQIQGIDFATPSGGNTEFTVEAWVNGYSGGGAQLEGAAVATRGIYGVNDEFNLGIDSTREHYRFYIRTANGTQYVVGSGTSPIIDGNWHHLVGVCNEANGVASLYYDGKLVNTESIPVGGGLDEGSTPFTIGAATGDGTNYTYQFAGFINDVAVYNYALSSNQVQNEYAGSGVAPFFVQLPPASEIVDAGSTLNIPVMAMGTPILGYQWSENGSAIAGAAATTNGLLLNAGLIYSNVPGSWNNGTLTLTVTNAYGTTNVSVTLSVLTSPVITANIPSQITLIQGQSYTYTLAASGAVPFFYQWLTNNVPDTTAGTNAIYALTNVQPGMSGEAFQCIITNSVGSITSVVSTLTVIPIPTNAYASAVLGMHPVGYWPMHEVEAAAQGDIETNYGTAGLLGTAYYPDWATTANGVGIERGVGGALANDPDQAVYFTHDASPGDTFTNFLFIPHTSPLSTLNAPFSVECWFYPNNTTSEDIWAQNGYEGLNAGTNGGGNGKVCGIRLVWQNGSTTGFEVYTFKNSSTLNTLGFSGVSGGNVSPLDNWYHLVLTCDVFTNITLYTNGVMAFATNATALYSPDYWTPLTIGGGRGGTRAVSGDVDEFAVYTNVITDIAQHYLDGTSESQAGVYVEAVLADNPAIYLRMDAPAVYTPPAASTWPELINYSQTNGTAVGNGVYTPGTMPGIVAGPATSAGVTLKGLSGPAVPSLSGISSFADAGSAPVYNPTGSNANFTVTAMFRGNPCDSRMQSIVGHGTNSWELIMSTNGCIVFNAGNTNNGFYNTNGATSQSPGDIRTVGVYNDGNWHQVVAVNATNVISIYVDGKLDTNGTPHGVGVTNIIPGNTGDVMIGSDPDFTNAPPGAGRQFAGQICEVAFFTNVLTPTQIVALYDAAGGVGPSINSILPGAATAGQGAGTSANFSVSANGTAPLAYQWYFNTASNYTGATSLQNNANYANVTTNQLTITNLTTGDGGWYYSIVTNNYGAATSSLASLTVLNLNPTNILFGVTNKQLFLTWPMDHIGWTLQSQANRLAVGISTNWVNVSGSTGTNQVVVPINLTNGSVFYRLIYAP